MTATATLAKVEKFIRSALELLEKSEPEAVEKVIATAASEPESEAESTTEVSFEGTKPSEEVSGEDHDGINRSEKIRDYFNKHGMAVRNKDVIEYIRKTYNTEVGPAHVSIIRKNMSGKATKAAPKASKTKAVKVKSKAKVEAKAKPKATKTTKSLIADLPMHTLCTNLLKKHGARDGLKLAELTDLVMKSGYSYKGDKGRDGVLQNVYQALHALAKEGNHAGYKGETPVIVKDPTSKRYKLNPKAKRVA